MPEPSSVHNPEILFQFAGPNSVSADTYALNTAISRIAAGEAVETVRQQTGWFEGVDGKWRYEISDHDAELSPNTIKDILVQVKGDRLPSVKLGDLITHEKLFAAYPHLKDIQVNLNVSGDDSVSGNVNAENSFAPCITLNVPENANPGRVKSVLLHEIQHVLQIYEGFARGGSAQEFNYRLDTLLTEINEVDAASMAQNRIRFLGEEPQTAYSFIAGATSVGQARIKYFAETYSYEELNEKFSKCLAQKKALDPHRAYLRLAGEVEARNVQAREIFTEEKRVSISPLTTQDIEPKDILMRFNSSDMHSLGIPQHLINGADTVGPRAAVLIGGAQFAKILLGEDADISSPLHEGGHLYLSILNDVANYPGSAPSIKDDFETVLKWFGVGQNEWDKLQPEQRRNYHEQFAESFEMYMTEGRSPSLALENEFRQFQGWMSDIYTDLNTQLPNAKLSDEIRAVFDRMLTMGDQEDSSVSSTITTQVQSELKLAGYDEKAADAHAAIFKSALKSFHARSGMSESDFLSRYQFSISEGISLAMDDESRLARAQLQGYGTNKIWYHGSFSAFDEFDPKRSGSSGFHFSEKREFAEQYASSKSMDMQMDADIVVRGFYLRGELFDFTRKDHLDRLDKFLPEEIKINGRYGMAAWFGGVEYKKADLLEAIQGIQVPYTGLDESAKEDIRTGKSHFMREGGAQVILKYDEINDKVEYSPKWEIDKIKHLEASIQIYSQSYGPDYFEIPLLQRQLDREKSNLIPHQLELNPDKIPGYDNWHILEAPELKEYLQKAGFSGALMQEKRNLNAVIFEAENIKEISAEFNPTKTPNSNLYTQSNLYKKSNMSGSGMSVEEVKSAITGIVREIGLPVSVVPSIAQLPNHIRENLLKDNALTDTAGIYDKTTKNTFLVASGINSPTEAVLTYLHENGHAAFRAAAGLNYESILDNVYHSLTQESIDRLKNENKSQLKSMQPIEQGRLVAEEWITQIAETNPRNTVFQTVISTFKSWLREINPDLPFTQGDIVHLLSKGKKQMQNNPNLEENILIKDTMLGTENVFRDLAKHSESFQSGNKIEGSKIEETLQQVFENNIEIEVIKNADLFHTDPQAKAEFSVYLSKGNHSADVTVFDLQDGNCFEQIFSTKGSGLGAPLYQALFAWAHNNDKCLTMDPEGITDINLLRRTEAAISSALKFNTTEHIGMYPEAYIGLLPDEDYQSIMDYRKKVTDMVYDDSLNERSQAEIDQLIPPPYESYKRLSQTFEKMWQAEHKCDNKEACYTANVNGMIEAVKSLVNRRIPEVKNYTIIGDNKIIDIRSGLEVDKKNLPTNPEQGIGYTTALRTVIANTNLTPSTPGENHAFNKEFGSGLLYRKSNSELSADRERWIRESCSAPHDTTPVAKHKGARI